MTAGIARKHWPKGRKLLSLNSHFDGKILSKQAEIPSSCGKAQGQHMEKIYSAIFLEVSVFMALIVF
jgi:hypothetical protein